MFCLKNVRETNGEKNCTITEETNLIYVLLCSEYHYSFAAFNEKTERSPEDMFQDV